MSSFAAMAALMATGMAHAADPISCNHVLIPSINAFEHDTRKTLDTLSIIDNAQSLDDEQKQEFDVTVPIYGVPVNFGFTDQQSSQFRQKTLSYFNQHKSEEEARWSLISEVTGDKTLAWANCMRDAQHPEIFAFFNADTITPDKATLYVRRFKTGKPSSSTLELIITGGTVQDPKDRKETDHLKDDAFNSEGDTPFIVNRNHGARVTAETIMDNLPAITSVIPKHLDPPKFPEVRIRVWGNLQQATVDETYPVGQFSSIPVSAGVRFNTNNVQLHIEELVNGKLCFTKIITSANLGDMMNSTPTWRLDRMRAGCNIDAVPVGTAATCFVDPKYFTECP
ncbi:hypothetical protein NKI79_26705 [Mesorhizobium sp. M0340]|uniref:hypothetical protein n=1 Tax=Mesorhizobium sp. M0340 TaxID=2956939 RepID=UPI0033367F62